MNAASAFEGLAVLQARLLDKTPLLHAIGTDQKSKVEARIRDSKVSPMGAAWSPWRPHTAASRARKGNVSQGLLWDSGQLLGSIAVAVDSSSVVIGSTERYAEYLQDGTPNMAAREFIGWSEEDFPIIAARAALYLETGL